MQLCEQLHHLPCKGNRVRALHLHTLSWDIPHGLVEVDFIPSCIAQFLRAHKQIRYELQGILYRESSLIFVYVP